MMRNSRLALALAGMTLQAVEVDTRTEIKPRADWAEEGSLCLDPLCDGHYELEDLHGCTCFNCAPCSACMDRALTCSKCKRDEDEAKEDVADRNKPIVSAREEISILVPPKLHATIQDTSFKPKRRSDEERHLKRLAKRMRK